MILTELILDYIFVLNSDKNKHVKQQIKGKTSCCNTFINNI